MCIAWPLLVAGSPTPYTVVQAHVSHPDAHLETLGLVVGAGGVLSPQCCDAALLQHAQLGILREHHPRPWPGRRHAQPAPRRPGLLQEEAGGRPAPGGGLPPPGGGPRRSGTHRDRPQGGPMLQHQVHAVAEAPPALPAAEERQEPNTQQQCRNVQLCQRQLAHQADVESLQTRPQS